MSDVMVIGIAGGTGSGKTTLAHQLVERVGDDSIVIAHDSYYRAHHALSFEERTLLNYDHPDAYETELLVSQLLALRNGESIACPIYDFSIHDRLERTVTVHPARVVIVEGILVLSEESLREQMDLKIFVDCDADVRVLRRTRRDLLERGRSLESVMEQYLATVKPMHDAFVEPSKRYADVIVNGAASNEAALDLLAHRAYAHLGL